MSAHVPDERAHAAAIGTAIETTLGIAGDVYDYGDVPGLDGNLGDEPPIYVLKQVERTFMPAAKTSRTASRTGWRATIRSVGTTANEARGAALRVHQALDGAVLTIGGRETTPIHHEDTSTPKPADGRHEVLQRWTYSI